jgi:nucleoside-diphosphate kinase
MLTHERTFVMIKPDAVQRALVGEIISRFERKGLKLVAMKPKWVTKREAGKLYTTHKNKPFYGRLEEYATSSPSILSVWEGLSAVSVARSIVGPTDPKEASPGTIRGDYGLFIERNIIHASDSKEDAGKEMKIFFEDSELCTYKKINESWLYSERLMKGKI